MSFEDIKKLAMNENPKAQYYLGMMYLSGKDVDKDTDKAKEWFKKSALKGNIGAQEMLKSLEISHLELRDFILSIEEGNKV